MKSQIGALSVLAILALAGCGDGRMTLRCDTEQECLQRSATECGGPDKFKVWRRRMIGEPIRWKLQTHERFEIECVQGPVR
jgi:hypothetical protein